MATQLYHVREAKYEKPESIYNPNLVMIGTNILCTPIPGRSSLSLAKEVLLKMVILQNAPLMGQLQLCKGQSVSVPGGSFRPMVRSLQHTSEWLFKLCQDAPA